MTPAVWQHLMSAACDELRAKAAAVDPASGASVAAITQLRKRFDADLVHAALQLAAARRKAEHKWPKELATKLVADPLGVEMASSWLVATHKAARIAASMPGTLVLDLCCGIGGDAMTFRAAGLEVLGVDRDPVRAWMCGVNAGCASRACDIADVSLPEGVFHIDPARRRTPQGGGTPSRRVRTLEELEPNPAALRNVLESRTTGVLKLAPGTNEADLREHGLLPEGVPYELEYVSERGKLTQLVVWLGKLAAPNATRRATRLPIGAATGRTLHGTPDAPGHEPPVRDELLKYLYEIDDSVERAGLLRPLCDEHAEAMLHASLGLLVSDRPIVDPMLTPFEAIAMMPWKQQRVEAELKRLGAGHVEVKTRGGIVNPDQLQPALSKKDGTPHTLFVLRFGRDLRAIIARRIRPKDLD